VSLSGCDLLVGGFFSVGVSHAGEALAFVLAKPHAVFGVDEVDTKHAPGQGDAADLAGEAADDLGAAFDLSQRSSQQVGGAPPPAVPRQAKSPIAVAT
jgi:hypothetical protein